MATTITFFATSSISNSPLHKFFESECRVRNRFCASASRNSLSTSNGAAFVNANEAIKCVTDERKSKIAKSCQELDVLWDDGYGTSSVKDYIDISSEMVKKPDGGPPRWFCPVECGKPIKGSPLLLFLPGMDGTGWGLILHHKSLGKVFEVRCLHIPVNDRTSFEELLEIIENTVREEHASFPKKPIYLVGDSLGGCLALAVAARNPTIDLVLVLSNPATSFGRSALRHMLPILEALPESLRITFTHLISIISGLTDFIPKEALLWKLQLLKVAAAYANAHLNAISAEVLVLASGKDNILPSADEARRLWAALPKCKVRHFKDNSHTLLLEAGLNVLSFIKAAHMYRRHSTRHDYISDFIPTSFSEFRDIYLQGFSALTTITSPVMLSTLGDGRIVRGLEGIPSKGPVILVGYHMLMGLELPSIVGEILKEKRVMVRSVGHPMLFSPNNETSSNELSRFDVMTISGTLPVSPSYLHRLLSNDEIVLLFPGGAREALHRKGEEYRCFWPDQPEFVRMAAKFGATIIPFGVVGVDDILHYVLDYDDQMKIPFTRNFINDINRNIENIRIDAKGEVANQDMFVPGVLPKIPGRFYYLFGKPIETKGMKEELNNKDNANVLYLEIKSEVENIMSYLVKKREKDPYRGILQRTIYKAMNSNGDQIPTFEL